MDFGEATWYELIFIRDCEVVFSGWLNCIVETRFGEGRGEEKR